MGLRDVLQSLGLPKGPVQPDVSGHTIANLLDQTAGQPGLRHAALGSLYEQVIATGGSGAEPLHLDLWRDGQPMASLLCMAADAGERCIFTYWDPEPEVNAFLAQVSAWMGTHLGEITQVTGADGLPEWGATGTGAVRSMSLVLIADEDTAKARVTVDLAVRP